MRRLVYVALTRAQDRVIISSTRRDDADWDAVLSSQDARGKPRARTEDDYFRSLALYVRETGAGKLLPTIISPEPDEFGGGASSIDAPPIRVALETPREEDKSRNPVQPDRIEVSFSQLEAFSQCPLRYEYIYEWKLPAPPDGLWPEKLVRESPSTIPASDLGTLVHSTLENFHRPGAMDGAGGLARLADLWFECSRGMVTRQLSEALWENEAAAMFEHYLSLDLSTYPTLATEHEFNLVEVIDGQEVLIRGFIDRLCQGPDGTVLIDYKTNAAIGDDSAAAYARQLAIYERASRVIFALQPRPVMVELRRGIEHWPQASSSWADVAEMLRAIVGGGRQPPSNPPCGPCAYHWSCPASTFLAREIGSDPLPD